MSFSPETGRSDPITEIDVLWITAGLGCDGDTIAMTAATQPSHAFHHTKPLLAVFDFIFAPAEREGITPGKAAPPATVRGAFQVKSCFVEVSVSGDGGAMTPIHQRHFGHLKKRVSNIDRAKGLIDGNHGIQP